MKDVSTKFVILKMRPEQLLLSLDFISLPSLIFDDIDRLSKFPLFAIFTFNSIVYGVAKILTVHPLVKFEFQCQVEWQVVCEYLMNKNLILISKNIPLNKVINGTEIPYNLGKEVLNDSIRNSLIT